MKLISPLPPFSLWKNRSTALIKSHSRHPRVYGEEIVIYERKIFPRVTWKIHIQFEEGRRKKMEGGGRWAPFVFINVISERGIVNSCFEEEKKEAGKCFYAWLKKILRRSREWAGKKFLSNFVCSMIKIAAGHLRRGSRVRIPDHSWIFTRCLRKN